MSTLAHRDDFARITVLRGLQNNLGTCLSGDPGTVGALESWQVWPPTAVLSGTIDEEQLSSVQLFYSSAAAARRGLASIEALYGACWGKGVADDTLDPHLVDTLSTTASSGWAIAILRTVRHPDGSPASTASVGSDSHEYLAQDGNVIYFVGLYGDAAIDSAAHDAQTLDSMRQALQNYRH